MAKRRRKSRGDERDATDVPALSGLALLMVETPVEVLDLHGMTGPQAEQRLTFFLERHAVTSPGRVVHIVTGKGTRSEGVAVLPRMVRQSLAGELAPHVAEAAGLPGGGALAVRIADG